MGGVGVGAVEVGGGGVGSAGGEGGVSVDVDASRQPRSLLRRLYRCAPHPRHRPPPQPVTPSYRLRDCRSGFYAYKNCLCVRVSLS
jgi:hypothetical protein